MSDRRETTLGDYFRVMQRRRLFIALVAAICGVAALGFSLLQTPSYESKASLSVRDPIQDLNLIGSGGFTSQTQLQIATSHLPQVTRPEVVQRVQRDLRSPLTTSALRSAVDAEVDPNSNLIVITAHARNARDSAAIANAFANTDANLTTDETRATYARSARQVQAKIRRLGGGPTTQAIYQDQLSRLQSLSTFAQPVAVATSAQVPSSPASPKPVRNTLIGLIFGLFLGIGLAYARETFDRRLRHASDVESVLPLPVVGYVPPDALGHAGGHGPSANGSHNMSAADAESFRILRENVRHLVDGELKTLLVTSALAQEGKSTVAACLALANAASGRRTLLVDCDLRRPVLAKRFGLSEAPGLTDYLLGNATPQEIIRPVAATLHAEEVPGAVEPETQQGQPLVCITAGTQVARPAELLSSERFQSFIDQVAEVYDSVIFDSAPLLTVADSLEIVSRVSGVLLCVRLEQTTREQARAAQTALARLPDRPTALVLTNVTSEDEGYYYGYYAAGGPEVAVR